MKKIVIEPITRIEGHAKITILLNEQGYVDNAYFHVTQFRGFEHFCKGRPFYEMPILMARTCGICPVAHLVAGAKACDEIMAVQIPETAKKLREIFTLAQLIQSHALSFFHLSSPDLFLGFDYDPERRNIAGLFEKYPELTNDGIILRKLGQSIIELLAGKRIHPIYAVPGGVNTPLNNEIREKILSFIPQILEITRKTINLFTQKLDNFKSEINTFGNFPTFFMGTVDSKGTLNIYDGYLRIVDASGNVIKDNILGQEYQKYIYEHVEDWTYLKFPYLREFGYPKGIYRVGPLARLNTCDQLGYEEPDKLFAEFKRIAGRPALSSFYYHLARLIEITYAAYRINDLLESPDILNKKILAEAGVNKLEGIGVAEAPRGTLIHHYVVDENGLITWANLIIATGHNNLAMNQAILQVARQYIKEDNIQDGFLNRVEAIIRAFDPCLSCGTHTIGQKYLKVKIYNHKKELIKEI